MNNAVNKTNIMLISSFFETHFKIKTGEKYDNSILLRIWNFAYKK